MTNKRVLPLECASIHYTCEQIEDSIGRHRRFLAEAKRWRVQAEADVEEYRTATYLSEDGRLDMMQMSEDAVATNEKWVAEAEQDINTLLELLKEAKSLEMKLLEFWQKKDKQFSAIEGGK